MSYNLSAVPKLQFFDNDGNPLVGGKLYTYEAGTTTPLATYTDSTGATPNTNPVILDSRGEANVWLAAQSYKFVLKTSTDTTIWTVDNVSNAINISQILASGGTAGAPPYSFSADTDTGVYLAAVGQLGLTANGTPFLRGSATAMTFGQSGGANDVDVTHYGDTAQTGNFTLTGAAVFNEAGADKDFRIEGDTDANLFFVDASTDRIGIGTNTPSVKFDVVGAVLVTGDSSLNGALVVNEAGADADTRIEGDTDANLVFVDASTDRVGVGINTPQSKLHVSSGAIDEVARFEGTGQPYISLHDSGVREFFIQATGGGINVYGETNKPMLFYTNSVARTQIAANGAQSSVIPGGSTLYPQFACRAWINFDGTLVTNPASTTGIRGSGNVSSVLDNGTGDYTINFTTAMPDANYAPVFGYGQSESAAAYKFAVRLTTSETGAPTTMSTTALRVICGSTSNLDFANLYVAIFR